MHQGADRPFMSTGGSQTLIATWPASPSRGSCKFDVFKLRALVVQPKAARHAVFYGIIFEFSFNSRRWNADHYTQELRPMIGWRIGRVDVIYNTILYNAWNGISCIDFDPQTRIDYNISKTWAVAAEEYNDFGELRHFTPVARPSHQLFAVFDYTGGPSNLEGGVGFGLNSATDDLTFKIILAKDLN